MNLTDLTKSENFYINLKCKKCSQRIVPPFQTCDNNHFVCERCKYHLSHSDNVITEEKECVNTEKFRVDLDKSFQNMVTFCQYECGIRATLKELAGSHESSCRKRNWPAICFFENCKWEGFTSDLLSHMDEHPGKVVINSKQENRTLKLSFTDKVTFVMLYNKSYFFNDLYWVYLIKEDNKRYVAVQRQGSVGNIGNQRMEEFTVFLTSIAEGIEGRIIEPAYREKFELEAHIDLRKIEVHNLASNTINVFLKESGTEILPEFLSSKLECPVCLSLLCGEIYICENGHSICGSCREKTEQECPFCKGEMSDIRNYALESLTNNCVTDCKYSEDGCDERVQTGNLKQHVEHCQFRKTDCLFVCDWEGPVAKFYEHYSTAHNWFKGNGVFHKIKEALDSEYYYADGLTTFGKTFFMKYAFTSDFTFRVEELTLESSSEFYFDVKIAHPTTGYSIGFTAPCWTTCTIKENHPAYADNRQIQREAFVTNIIDEKGEFLVSLSVFMKL